MDRDTLAVLTAFGSFTDPGFTAATGPLGHISGRVAFAWAGAVLHVLSAEDVRAFATHVHAVLAPGGVWFGVRCPSDHPLSLEQQYAATMALCIHRHAQRDIWDRTMLQCFSSSLVMKSCRPEG